MSLVALPTLQLNCQVDGISESFVVFFCNIIITVLKRLLAVKPLSEIANRCNFFKIYLLAILLINDFFPLNNIAKWFHC